jgi:hypothetical protein
MNWKIDRPPLANTFHLPTREELMKLKVGDIVKLIFRGPEVERMWVIITEQQDSAEWTGVLDNDPFDENFRELLKSGDKIVFHPLDIIDIHDSE